MLRLNVVQPVSTAGDCPSPLLQTPAGGKVKLKWGKERWPLKGKSAWFGSILMKKKAIKRFCVGCVHKSLHITTRTERGWKHIQQKHLHFPLQPTDAVMPMGQKTEHNLPGKWLPRIRHSYCPSFLLNSYLNVISLSFVNYHVLFMQCALTTHNKWLKVSHISAVKYCFLKAIC